MRHFSFFAALLLLGCGAAASQAPVHVAGDFAARVVPGKDPVSDAELVKLGAWMAGSYSSAAQAASDPAFFDVRLHIVRIWPWRRDAVWLYVEQAMATHLDAPYRQRVYRLSRLGPERFASEVYTLPDPAAAVGVWKLPEPLKMLEPSRLLVREGCAVLLSRTRDGYAGGTEGKGCASDINGASHATSEVTVDGRRLVSWDRGYDASGRQVWGARKGGYVFIKD
ncbi:MAG: chromophore lyase CpcT/CpeT [Candidatus Sericytochromatia bacterium]|nr:chromophore lyase CpcT/CpeT [Candidatus Sericytochromatia bacterium]